MARKTLAVRGKGRRQRAGGRRDRKRQETDGRRDREGRRQTAEEIGKAGGRRQTVEGTSLPHRALSVLFCPNLCW